MKKMYLATIATFISFILWFLLLARYGFALMYQAEYKGEKELTIEWGAFFVQFPIFTLFFGASVYYLAQLNKERRERVTFMRKEIAASVRRQRLEDQERELKEKMAKRAEEKAKEE